MKDLTRYKKILNLILFISFLWVLGGLSGCGVKGKPLPPLKPAPLSDPDNKASSYKNNEQKR